jgi:ribose transport system ATP-binding protein
VYVPRDGHLAGELETASTTATASQRLMVGRELEHEYYRESLQTGGTERAVLRVNGLSGRGEFQDVSFDVRAGEIVGLCSVLGSGCEGVLRSLAGLRRPTSGTSSWMDNRGRAPTRTQR